MRAALEDIETLACELCWCHNLPGAVLAAPAPTDDERDEQERMTAGAQQTGGARRAFPRPIPPESAS